MAEIRYCFEAADDFDSLEHARKQARRQPALNFQIAKVYLEHSDPAYATRTWQHVMDEMARLKPIGPTRERWERAMRQAPFELIRNKIIIETKAQEFFDVLATGTICTNVFMRRLHNFAADMDWLPKKIIPRRLWPAVEYQEKRGVTLDEHKKIVAGERNREWRAYYNTLWHLGGSQTDVAVLEAGDVDWKMKTISFSRIKTGSPVQMHFGDGLQSILEDLPGEGFLFPMIARWKESDRAKAFIRRCRLVQVEGVCLSSYRYAWAERARLAGYPERFAQEALGHKSAAVHRSYAKLAKVKVPSLEDYERQISAR